MSRAGVNVDSAPRPAAGALPAYFWTSSAHITARPSTDTAYRDASPRSRPKLEAEDNDDSAQCNANEPGQALRFLRDPTSRTAR